MSGAKAHFPSTHPAELVRASLDEVCLKNGCKHWESMLCIECVVKVVTIYSGHFNLIAGLKE